MMSFEDFCNYVANEVLNVKPEWKDRTATVKDVRKNNGVVLKGLTIHEDGKNVFPTVYLEHYYEEMDIQELTKEETLERIACDYERFLENAPEFDWVGDLQENKIIGILVNREQNEELLKDIPHLLIGDSLAVIFKYLLAESEEGTSTVTITDYLAEVKGYDENALMKIALKNTPELMKLSFNSMFSVLFGVGGNVVDKLEMVSYIPQYVLTNMKKQWGAFAILYPEVREMLFSKFNSDIVILPSSIHELIVLPLNEEVELSDMDEMVKEVNETELRAEEILADKAFVLKQDGSDDISKFLSYYTPEISCAGC